MESDRSSLYLVVGISSEQLHGNEGTLYSPDIIVEIDGQRYYSPHQAFCFEDLKPLLESNRRYVTWLADDERFSIKQGQYVYLAGTKFLNLLGQVSEITPFSYDSQEWTQLSIGYSWAVMEDHLFRYRTQDIIRSLWIIIDDYLWSLEAPPEYPSSLIKRVVAAYSQMMFWHSNKRIAYENLGLYYYVVGDAKALNITSQLALRSSIKKPITHDEFTANIVTRAQKMKCYA